MLSSLTRRQSRSLFNRVHPDSLPHEAADVLRKVIEGQTVEMVDRALARLFDEMIERETDSGEGDDA